MKCKNCGAELTDDAKFCSYCGTKIEHKNVNDVESEAADQTDYEESVVESVENADHAEQYDAYYTAAKNMHVHPARKETLGDKVKLKLITSWNGLDLFCKIITVAIAFVIALLLVSVGSKNALAIFFSILQIGGLIVAVLMHKNIINLNQRNWVKYIVLAAAMLFTTLNIMSYSWGNKIVQPSEENSQFDYSAIVDDSSAEEKEETNYTIEKGTEYAWMSDEWNVYIATAISDSVIKIECWDKTLSSTKKLEYSADIGTYKINDAANGFSWIDEEHTAFLFTLQDKNNSNVKKPTSVVFTININDSDKFKGTDYDEEIACYSFQNDDWHLYRVIPLTEKLVKLECWARSSSIDDFCFGWDVGVIDIANTDTDFEWTDEDRTSCTITMQDKKNDYYWKDSKFVAYELENPDYKYKTVLAYIGRNVVGEGEVAAPDSASSFKYKNYKDVQEKLENSGFTNISTEILYDIVWGWTDEGEVDSVSIDGNTDFEKGDVFSKDAPIIITYHMKEEDDPQKATEQTESTEKTSEQTTPKSTAEETEVEQNLTVDNCQDLKDLLAVKDPLDSSIADFASKYSGRIIEFDGRVDYCTKHENYNTRFDYLVSAGDYDPDHQIGPTFKFEDVNYSDLHTNLDTVSVGLNVHIVAEVVSYNSGSGLFFLDPVSVTGR